MKTTLPTETRPRHKCGTCGKTNRIVNECRCDPNNLPTKLPATEYGPGNPDPRPGNYYVSAVDGPNYYLMLGPFPNDHAAALARVDEVRAFTKDKDTSGRAHFMGFGTVRMAETVTRPGNLNKYLNLN